VRITYEMRRLEGLVSFTTGKLNSNAAKPDGKYPFYTCSQETFLTDTWSFDGEYVLLAGNNAAGVYPLKYFVGKFDAYQRTYAIRTFNERSLLTRYLYYALRPQMELLRSISTGAATKFLTLTLLNQTEIPVPPVSTQCKIASILSAYDDLIGNNLRRIKILEEMAQALYREWFVKFRFPGHEKVRMVDSPLGKIPEGWEVVRLGERVELAYGRGLRKAERKPGDIPVFGSSGIVGYHSQSIADGPGIVVGRKGNVGTVFWSDTAFYPIDTVFYVKTDLPVHYVYYNLQHQNFINNDAAVPGLNRNQAHSLPFIVPAKRLIDHFSESADLTSQQTSNLKSRVENLRQTRDLLLPKLISGELDVSELDISIPEEAT